MNSVCIFCGSREGALPIFKEKAQEVATLLASRQIRVVMGGGRVGLMGAVASAALAQGGEVIGVIPEFLKSREVGHTGLSQLITVGSMHDRKRTMAELAEAFVILPGGIGTLEELFEVFTWQNLSLHHKPIGILNVAGFYEPLLNLLHSMVKQGFLSESTLERLIIEDNPPKLLDRLADSTSPSQGKPADLDKI